MKLIDLHSDTIYKLWKTGEGTILENEHQIDIPRLKKADSLVQVMAMFIERGEHGYDYKNLTDFLHYYEKTLSEIPELNIVLKSEKIGNEGVNILKSVEDLGSARNLDDVAKLYDKGFRMMSLTWNHENKFGNKPEGGLKRLGFEAVELLDHLGCIIDVSHLDDKGPWDVLDAAKGPVIASHSGAREVGNVRRNLPDELIRAIGNSGGVMGLNFSRYFMAEDKKSSVDNMIRQMGHIRNVGGIDSVAIGTDFDGILRENLEIDSVDEMWKLEKGLKQAGFGMKDIEKIFYRNALRVIEEIL